MPNHLATAFNAGELSPYMDSRTDVEKYKSGCKRLENMVVLPYGGAYRRPGTEYMGEAKRSNKRCRLIGFNFSTTTRFIIEMGEGYMRFWSNGVQVPAPTPTATWATGNSYTAGSYFIFNGQTYYVQISHIADQIANDVASGKISQQTALEVPSPYSEAVLREVQYIQINDLMYFTHADHPVYKLTRLADNNWKMEAVSWDYPPMIDISYPECQFTASAPTGAINVTTRYPFFSASDVGTELALTFGKQILSVKAGIAAANAYSSILPLDANTSWDFQTTGTWNGTINILRKSRDTMNRQMDFINVPLSNAASVVTANIPNHDFQLGDTIRVRDSVAPFQGVFTISGIIDNNNFTYNSGNNTASTGTGTIDNITQMEVVRSYYADGDRNIISSGKETYRTELIVQQVGTSAVLNDPYYMLEARDYQQSGRVKITAVTSAYNATANVTEYLGAWTGPKTSTIARQTAFCSKYGYPRCVTAHQQRLIFAGTRNNPQTLWASVTDDFQNFETGTDDDDSFQFTIAANESNRVNWIYSQKGMMLGTSGDEWSITGDSDASALTPSNIRIKRQTSFGSKYMKAVMVNDVLLFLQRSGRKVRELTYSFDRDGWVAPDLCVLAEQIAESGFEEMAFQQQPDAILYCIRNDGVLAAMSYEREQNVVAWGRHITEGNFESVATIYGDTSSASQNDDEVWFVVKRTINGVTKRYIERFRSDFRQVFFNEDKPNYWYLDCGKRYSGAATDSVTGLSHLSGEAVSVLADGVYYPNLSVVNGTLALPKAHNTILVGYPFTSVMQPMNIDLMMRDGPSNMRHKRIYRVSVDVYKSLSGEVSTDNEEWLWLYSRGLNDNMDEVSDPFTGVREVVVGGDYKTEASFLVRQALPYPLTIRALVIKLDAYGD